MGEVYRARDIRLDRTVALKVLREERLASPQLRSRLEREARTISALAHPHIRALFDVGQQDGRTFLVMEHLEGQTLSQRLLSGALTLARSLEVAIQIADALSAARTRPVVELGPVRCYAVSQDGSRFFATQNQPLPDSATHVRIVQGWVEELEARVSGEAAR